MLHSQADPVPVGRAKFDVNRCNESHLQCEKPDFWPVSKFNTGSLSLCGNPPCKDHIFEPTAGARCTIFPKLRKVIELVEAIEKGAFIFFYPTHSFSYRVHGKIGLSNNSVVCEANHVKFETLMKDS